MSSMGLASAAEQLKVTFAPLQTVSSLTRNWTPSGWSVMKKKKDSISAAHMTRTRHVQISLDISIFDSVNSARILLSRSVSSKVAPKVPVQLQASKKKQWLQDLENLASNVLVIELLTLCDAALNALS